MTNSMDSSTSKTPEAEKHLQNELKECNLRAAGAAGRVEKLTQDKEQLHEKNNELYSMCEKRHGECESARRQCESDTGADMIKSQLKTALDQKKKIEKEVRELKLAEEINQHDSECTASKGELEGKVSELDTQLA